MLQSIHSCENCFLREECGGFAQQGAPHSLLGCFEPCSGCTGKTKCTFTCPSRQLLFFKRLSEAGMFSPLSSQRFPSVRTETFGRYVPLLQGGLRFKRPVALDSAALNLAEIFHGDKAHGIPFGRRVLTADSLRSEWGLRPDAQILISGVAKDKHLEKIWANYREAGLAQQLAALRVSGVTAPNFTFWKDKPRMHNLWNRRRMLRVCENFADAGVPMIPHINSTHPADWDFWRDYLKDHPEITAVCMEFGTGNKKEAIRDWKIKALLDLSESLGRSIHPVILGGINAAAIIGSYFLFYTAIDSTPTMKTIYRQRAIDSANGVTSWRTDVVPEGTCMAEAFDANYQEHHEGVTRRLISGGPAKKTQGTRQAEFLRTTPSKDANLSIADELPLTYS
jgi:hypothetical protein